MCELNEIYKDKQLIVEFEKTYGCHAKYEDGIYVNPIDQHNFILWKKKLLKNQSAGETK